MPGPWFVGRWDQQPRALCLSVTRKAAFDRLVLCVIAANCASFLLEDTNVQPDLLLTLDTIFTLAFAVPGASTHAIALSVSQPAATPPPIMAAPPLLQGRLRGRECHRALTC